MLGNAIGGYLVEGGGGDGPSAFQALAAGGVKNWKANQPPPPRPTVDSRIPPELRGAAGDDLVGNTIIGQSIDSVLSKLTTVTGESGTSAQFSSGKDNITGVIGDGNEGSFLVAPASSDETNGRVVISGIEGGSNGSVQSYWISLPNQKTAIRLIGTDSGVGIYFGGDVSFKSLGIRVRHEAVAASAAALPVATPTLREQQNEHIRIRNQNSAEVGTYYFGAVAVGVALELAAVAAIAGGARVLSGARALHLAQKPTVGVLEDAAFAQIPAKATKEFSREGQKIFSAAAGRPIKTVSDLTDALIDGRVTASQVPLDYVVINGQKVIANTRSSQALINAGIPKNQWFGVNRTGQTAYDDVTFDTLVQRQLNKNYDGSVSKARR